MKVSTEIGNLLKNGSVGVFLADKLIELLFKSNPNIPLEKMGTNDEVKQALKIISEGLSSSPELFRKLANITNNMQSNQKDFIFKLLNEHGEKDKEIIIQAIKSQGISTSEDTKGFWSAFKVVGSVALGASVGIVGLILQSQTAKGKISVEKYKIDNEKKPFWYK